jgi:hypothetical protein
MFSVARYLGFGILVCMWLGATGCEKDEMEAGKRDEALWKARGVKETSKDHSEVGILQEILGEPKRIKESDPLRYAQAFVSCLYRDGDIATAMDSIAWQHSLCRIGQYQCNDLSIVPRRVGALVSMVPNHELRPDGMSAEMYQANIAPTLRELVPAPDKALPYIPKTGERLMTFSDHYGLTRYLLLRRAGDTWRVVGLGSADQFRG